MNWLKSAGFGGLKSLVNTAGQLLNEPSSDEVPDTVSNPSATPTTTATEAPVQSSSSFSTLSSSTPASSSHPALAASPIKKPTPKIVERTDYKLPRVVREYVRELCTHPDTFTKFPLDLYVDKRETRSWQLNSKQEEHAKVILDEVGELRNLRYALCPTKLNDNQFWHIYFLLLRNKGIDLETKGSVADEKRRSIEEQLEAMWEHHLNLTMESGAGIDDGIDPFEDSYFSNRSNEIASLTLSSSISKDEEEEPTVPTTNILSSLDSSAPPSPAPKTFSV